MKNRCHQYTDNLCVPSHLDIAMVQLLNAYQRDEDEWLDLFRRAGPYFKLRGHSRPSVTA